jgi:hypothetical protein
VEARSNRFGNEKLQKFYYAADIRVMQNKTTTTADVKCDEFKVVCTRCFNLPLRYFSATQTNFMSKSERDSDNETFSYSADFHRLIDDLKIL